MCQYFKITKKETNSFLEAARFEPEEEEFIKTLFLELRCDPIALLLSQADWGQLPYKEVPNILLEYAKKIYGKNNVLHIRPPVSVSIDVEKYFFQLGEQCQLMGVDNEGNFESALKTRLEQTEQLFLLVSRFEQGAEAPRKQLSSIIRAISDENNSFHVVLCGGEQLVDLKYQNGSMSLLNKADIKYWPELTPLDVYTLSHHYDVSLDNENVVNEFLAISGADPKLLRECLILKKQFPDLPLEKYPEKLSQSSYVYGLLTPLVQDQTTRRKMRNWLNREEVGKAEPYIMDNVLRKLYWKNLLVERNNHLYWRCEAMRIAGKNIIGNDNQQSSTVQYFSST
ncbi:hypothetical protein BGP_0737 [Beggiatoa sp. PS]|nr:hypothetical protein BGP_0737 [Beggiatoa sp. PS]